MARSIFDLIESGSERPSKLALEPRRRAIEDRVGDEEVALYTFNALLQNLRFGYGSALSVVIFAITFGLALLYVKGLGVRLGGEER